MRKILIYTAILTVLTLCVIYKSDYVRVEITELLLKNDLNAAAYGAVMLLDEQMYADGYVEFKDVEVKKYMQEVLADTCTYTYYIFDDSGVYRCYDHEGNIKQESFSFPYFYVDPQTNKKIKLEEPAIIIQGNIEKEFYRISQLKNEKYNVTRSTMYTVEDKKLQIKS